MLQTLRIVGILEGISFLLLLGYAMPLKYFWDDPAAVQQVGMAHGILWILYIGLIGWGQLKGRWRIQTTAWLIAASLLPAGPFVADFKILSKEPA